LISVRAATQDDNSELLTLEEMCPEGTNLVLQFDRSPDYFFRSGVYDNFKCYVAEEEGRIVGTATTTLKHFWLSGEVLNSVYIRDLRVHPKFRRRNIGSKLVQHATVEEQNADLAYALVMEDNTPSAGLFQNLGYNRIRDLTLWTVPLYKRSKTTQGTIREMTGEDLPKVVELINDYYNNYDFFTPICEDEFADRMIRLRKYGLRNMLVAESEEGIVACAGLWDYSDILRPSVLRLRMNLRILSRVLRILNLFTNAPKLSAVGELFKLTYAVNFAHAKGSLTQLENLLDYCLALSEGYRSHFLCFPLDASDPRKTLIRKHQAIPVKYQIYVRSLKARTAICRSEVMTYADPLDF